MFTYPKQAEVNRTVPKNKIYAHGRVSKRLKAIFVEQVAEIVWKYKLSPETLNLPAAGGIQEIQIFDILLKTPELDEAALAVIDKAIQFPLVFRLLHGGEVRYAASYKRPSEGDASKWVIEASFITASQPADAPCPPLPVALDMASLYEQMLRGFIPFPPRAGEGIREQVARFLAIEAADREREQLEAELAREKQFNRKVDTNAALRSLCVKLDALKHP